jgi:mono/diheme cytochrome c family protein
MKTASELTALAEKDALFREGQTIAQLGISQQGVPACMACHGPLGEGLPQGPAWRGKTGCTSKTSSRHSQAGPAKRSNQCLCNPWWLA